MKRLHGLILGAGLLLAGCGQQTSTPSGAVAPPGPYGDRIKHNWTASQAEGQRLYSQLSATLPNTLKTQDFNVGVFITATNGWGPIELNTSNGEAAPGDGHPITLKGKVYPTGLGVHADSEIHIHAIGFETPACTHFKADVGIDDEVGANGKYSDVIFQVYADGEKLFDSGHMTGGSPTQHIDVAIGNKSDLRFVVIKGLEANYYDHADWAGATLTCVAPVAAPSLMLDRSSLDIYHLHSNTLQATFAGWLSGAVQLRLVADPIAGTNPGSTREPPPLRLDTTSVVLTGSATQTVPISISAPVGVREFGGTQSDHDTYHLVASISGTDVSSVPVTLTELKLNLSSHFEPDTISGRVGEVRNLILVTTIDPPLTGPVKITAGINFTYNVRLLSSGVTTGTGGELRTPVQVAVAGDISTLRDNLIAVNIDGVASGYRDVWYRNLSIAHLYVSTIP